MLKRNCKRLAIACLILLCGTVAALAQEVTVSGTGSISVDGVPIQGSARVATGSVVLTEGDGDAVVDLGALGKVVMRPNTEIKFTLAPNSVQMLMDRCGSITVTAPV